MHILQDIITFCGHGKGKAKLTEQKPCIVLRQFEFWVDDIQMKSGSCSMITHLDNKIWTKWSWHIWTVCWKKHKVITWREKPCSDFANKRPSRFQQRCCLLIAKSVQRHCANSTPVVHYDTLCIFILWPRSAPFWVLPKIFQCSTKPVQKPAKSNQCSKNPCGCLILFEWWQSIINYENMSSILLAILSPNLIGGKTMIIFQDAVLLCRRGR